MDMNGLSGITFELKMKLILIASILIVLFSALTVNTAHVEPVALKQLKKSRPPYVNIDPSDIKWPTCNENITSFCLPG